MIFGSVDAPIPEVDVSEQRVAQLLGDIKRNSRNRRIALFAPVVLAVAVIGAMIAAPPQHGGLAMVADAETSDPRLPQVFGSNGVWRLAEPIEDGAAVETGPASVIEAPADPDAPAFVLSPPTQEDLHSLPTSTSTPPTSTSGQARSGAVATEAPDPSLFSAEIRIEPAVSDAQLEESPLEEVELEESPLEEVQLEDSPLEEVQLEDSPLEAAAVEEDAAPQADPGAAVSALIASEPVETDVVETQTAGATAQAIEETRSTPEDSQPSDDVTVAANPQTESTDLAEVNPSTPPADLSAADAPAFSTPAVIISQSVLVHSARVSVTVQVVDDDSSVIDWCTTRVDWGDGSVTRVAGVDDDALCTASCEYEATSSASSEQTIDGQATATIAQSIQFEHTYTSTIDASPRIFVATGDNCSFTLAELQLAAFTVVPRS